MSAQEKRWIGADQGKKPCDCDLDLAEHPYNSDHFRACKALYDGPNADLADTKCQIVRGHEGHHSAVVTYEVGW